MSFLRVLPRDGRMFGAAIAENYPVVPQRRAIEAPTLAAVAAVSSGGVSNGTAAGPAGVAALPLPPAPFTPPSGRILAY
jgi:hypothetical protein